MKTKDEIIRVALKLFNRRGTRRVTTNHIAAEASISPGNLYYHFRNKEAIIRDIFVRMDETGRGMFAAIFSKSPDPAERMEAAFRSIQAFNRRFIFFKRELPALVMGDPKVKKLYLASHRAHLAMIGSLVDESVESGYLKPMDGSERRAFAELSWFLALYWINYLEVSGEPIDDRGIQRGIALSRFLLEAVRSPSSRG
ncbi:MAG: TetR/AcrR family transcriptional regulator [Candidatus Riflebacteria bacterium]|nr:TetR/AcrR family transcriptional regulator [Candidatus Riflebacteria bacterium]